MVNPYCGAHGADAVAGGEPDAEHGRGGGDRRAARMRVPDPRRASASSSSESSIASPSSSSEGRREGRGCRQASTVVAQLAGQVGAEAAQRPGAGADRARGRGRASRGGAGSRRPSTRRASAPASRRRPRGRRRGPRPARAPCRRACRPRRRARSAPAPSVRRATPKSISFARGSPLLGDEDVLRLDVAVDDGARVGVVERLAEVGADLADLAVAERRRRG